MSDANKQLDTESLMRKLHTLKIKQIGVAGGASRDQSCNEITVAALCEDGSVWVISPACADANWEKLPDIVKK